MRFVSLLLAATTAVALGQGAARADVLPDPGGAAPVPAGTCWASSDYFDDATATRLCFVSETTATYEGRVGDYPDVLCRGKATVRLEGERLVVEERDGACSPDGGTWTAETITCLWDVGSVGTGGPVGCTVAEGADRRSKLTLTRE